MPDVYVGDVACLYQREQLAEVTDCGFRFSDWGETFRQRVDSQDCWSTTSRWIPGRGRTATDASQKDRRSSQIAAPLRSRQKPDEFVLTWEGGKPVRDFRDRWDKLTKAANMEGLLLHDLRRSAVRNLVRAGVPERVAMTISGHKTRAIFDRYNIVSETDLAEAAKKIKRSRENSLSTAQVAATAEASSKAEQQLIN